MIFLIGAYSGKISIGRPECGLLWVTILKAGKKEEEKGWIMFVYFNVRYSFFAARSKGSEGHQKLSLKAVPP